MWKPTPRIGALIVLSGILALGSVACSSNDSANLSSEATNAAPASPSRKPAASPSAKLTASPFAKPTASPKAQKQETTSPQEDTYQQAIDVATGAITISKSAVSRNDWALVASRWQQAINLLKAVPASSSQHPTAQAKVAQYQRFLADAKQKATPLPKKPQQGDVTPQFFAIPIKGRVNGIPLVEITFHGTRKFEMLFDTGATGTLITLAMAQTLELQPVGITKGVVADGAVVELPLAFVNSIEADGRLKRKVPVAIAPAAMPVGLLGNDFFEGYDISIKENIIEFQRR